MEHRLKLQRLDRLYADLDVPASRPAERAPEIDQTSESPPSAVAGQRLDIAILPEANQSEVAVSNQTVQVLDVSTLPVIPNPLPAPITSEPQIDVAMQVTRPADQPIKTDEPGQADWKAIGIGAVTGTVVSGIILLITLQLNIFNNPGRLVLWGGEMFLGIIGALVANSWKSASRELWRAAIQWTLFPVWFALLIGLILLLLTFTSLTG